MIEILKSIFYDNILKKALDLSLLRTVFETFVKPIEGTLTLKSHRFVKLEAGKGSAHIPVAVAVEGGIHGDFNPQITHGHTRKVATAYHKRRSPKYTGYGDYGLIDYDSTDRFPRDVLRFKWDKQKSALCPTQKPVAACEYMIRTYTNPGDVVLDSCMGSGTTGVAALSLGRKFIGIEIDLEMFDKADRRISSHYGNPQD